MTQVYRKEILPVGEIDMPSGGRIKIDQAALLHLSKTFHAMSTGGYRVPLQLEHAPGTSVHGRVEGLEVAKNRRGLDALFARVRFDSDRAAARFGKSPWDCSVYIPSRTSHSGKEYPWALQHLALTRWPVIRGMDPFEPLADHQPAGRRSQQGQQQAQQQAQPAAVAAGAGVANKPTRPAKSPLVKDAEARFLREVAKKGSWHRRKVDREIAKFKKMMAQKPRHKMVRHPTM